MCKLCDDDAKYGHLGGAEMSLDTSVRDKPSDSVCVYTGCGYPKTNCIGNCKRDEMSETKPTTMLINIENPIGRTATVTETKPPIEEQILAMEGDTHAGDVMNSAILASLTRLRDAQGEMPEEPDEYDACDYDGDVRVVRRVDYDSLKSYALHQRDLRMKAEGNVCRHGWRGTMPDAGERIATPCPACGCQSLFIGSGGHLICARVPSDGSDGCPSPSVQDTIKAISQRAEQAESALAACRQEQAKSGVHDIEQFYKDDNTAPASGVREGMMRAAEICKRPKPECCGRFESDDNSMNLVCCGKLEPGEFMDGLECAEAITRAADQVNAEPHSDHPMRHYDRTCPACNADQPADAVVVPRDDELCALSKDSWERKYHKVRTEISLDMWDVVYKRAYLEGFRAAQEAK